MVLMFVEILPEEYEIVMLSKMLDEQKIQNYWKCCNIPARGGGKINYCDTLDWHRKGG